VKTIGGEVMRRNGSHGVFFAKLYHRLLLLLGPIAYVAAVNGPKTSLGPPVTRLRNN
jgi:hypothetical protein